MPLKKIKSALISVYYKDHLEPIIALLKHQGVTIYSTGGTQEFIEAQGAQVVPVEELTSYPSIFGGRVKTLHPKIFGGILHRRDHDGDVAQAAARIRQPFGSLLQAGHHPKLHQGIVKLPGNQAQLLVDLR